MNDIRFHFYDCSGRFLLLSLLGIKAAETHESGKNIPCMQNLSGLINIDWKCICDFTWDQLSVFS